MSVCYDVPKRAGVERLQRGDARPSCSQAERRRHDSDGVADILHWISLFQTDTMVIHGVSMGGVTTMMTSGEELSEGIKDVHFVEDCGYTSVWDEFSGELKGQFGLPEFPLMYSTSLLCRLRYGWSFEEASAIGQVGKCKYPMLFIHGDEDTFVPTKMVYRLYEAKPSDKGLWITEGVQHTVSYMKHREEYIQRVRNFVSHSANDGLNH